jgi:hypothetical protein
MDNPLVPAHRQMRAYDRDLIRAVMRGYLTGVTFCNAFTENSLRRRFVALYLLHCICCVVAAAKKGF